MKKQLRFCFVTTHRLSRHASIKRSLGMAPVLAAAGHRVLVLLQEHPENRSIAAGMQGVEVVFFPAIRCIGERRWKAQFLRQGCFDVIVYNSLCWRNAVKNRGLSKSADAFIEHCELESANKGTSPHRRAAQWLLEWWSFFAFDGHICASRYLLDVMKRRAFMLGLKRTIFWSPYGVDSSVCDLASCEPDRRDARKLVFHVGTVAKNYGCVFMIQGLGALRRRRTDWRACFVGKGRDLEMARRTVVELGLKDHVSFPGYVSEEELRAELAGANVFLSHLNDTEQDWARCPSKLYYYMALGRPVVTSSVGENRVALGDSGFYYRSDDPEDFASAVEEALDVPDTWNPSYLSGSVSWERRTKDFLREIGCVKG